jgi:simple sugar transport system substrate-binding protein/ribose transport system substrate-binding protein
MSRVRLALTATTMLAIAATGCGAVTSGSSNDSDDGFELAEHITERIDDGDQLRIRLSYHDPSLAFAQPIRAGMTRAGDELDVDVDLIGPTGGSANDQVAELQTLINQGQVDGIAVSSASSDALKPVIAQAYDAGIPIISFNTNNPESQQMAFVGQDLYESGRSEAEELLSIVGEATGNVVVFSVDTGAGWSHDRFSGFEAGLEGSGLEIVGPVNTGNEPSAAYNTVESTMTGQSDTVAIASLDCCSFTAAAQWVEQSGNAGEIHVVGFDVLPQTVEYLDRGVVDMTISQNPAEQGYQAVKILVDFLQDGTELVDVDTGAQIVTSDNVDDVPVEG